MKTIIHKAESRGSANHGWLKAHHTFSFANYYDPERIHFGALRVLNDDIVSGGEGFGTHPHENMEIITIPLEGDLRHKDNMGNESVIQEGKVQVMSAGTGILHSEMNANKDMPVKLLQIWIFPNKKDVLPRYDEVSLDKVNTKNTFGQILSPNYDDEGVWIYQNAWFHLANLDEGKVVEYSLHDTQNGIYLFVIEGVVKINDIVLEKRDGLGVTDLTDIELQAFKDSKVLLMEVPMKW